ncbi:hypothetical protein Tco_1574316 [Tanacetum coccineum]
MDTGGSPRHQYTIGVLKFRLDSILPTPHDSPLSEGYTPGSDEGRLKLDELMALCTKLSKQVIDLEKDKDAQAVEILRLKKVKKFERQRQSSTSQPRRRKYKQIESSVDSLDEEDASKQGRKSDKTNPMFQDENFNDIDDLVNKGIDFVQEQDAETQGKNGTNDTEVLKVSGDTEEVNTAEETVSTARPEFSTAGPEVSAADVPVTPSNSPTTTSIFGDEDLTIAQTLMKLKEEKAKEKGVAFKEMEDSLRPARSITTLQPLSTIDPKDKEKGVLVEEEPVKVKR